MADETRPDQPTVDWEKQAERYKDELSTVQRQYNALHESAKQRVDVLTQQNEQLTAAMKTLQEKFTDMTKLASDRGLALARVRKIVVATGDIAE